MIPGEIESREKFTVISEGVWGLAFILNNLHWYMAAQRTRNWCLCLHWVCLPIRFVFGWLHHIITQQETQTGKHPPASSGPSLLSDCYTYITNMSGINTETRSPRVWESEVTGRSNHYHTNLTQTQRHLKVLVFHHGHWRVWTRSLPEYRINRGIKPTDERFKSWVTPSHSESFNTGWWKKKKKNLSN